MRAKINCFKSPPDPFSKQHRFTPRDQADECVKISQNAQGNFTISWQYNFYVKRVASRMVLLTHSRNNVEIDVM